MTIFDNVRVDWVDTLWVSTYLVPWNYVVIKLISQSSPKVKITVIAIVNSQKLGKF